MKHIMVVRGLLGLMALYDGLLGIAFLFAGPKLFDAMEVTPPNHWGYVQFSAAVLLIFALMFLAAAKRTLVNRGLLPYCFLLKIAYSGVVFYHWFLGDGLPGIWKPFAVADVIMAAILAWMFVMLRSSPRRSD